MPTRATHHRPPPPTTPSTPTPSGPAARRTADDTSATPPAVAAPPPVALRDASPTPPTAHLHADGFEHAPRAPYGVRLGDAHLSLTPPPDLTVREPPRAPESTPAPHAEPTPSLMERGIDTFPAVGVIPDFRTFPTVSPSTSSAHDGTPAAELEASRAAARADERGRAPPMLAPPTTPDRALEDATHAVTESIERGAFCASPAGASSPDCPPRTE